MRPYSLLEIYQPLGGTRLNVQGGCHSFSLKTEAVRYFLTSVNFYQPALNNISEVAMTSDIFLGKYFGIGIAAGYVLSFLRFTCSRKTSFCCWHDPLRSQTFRTTDGTGSLSSHLQFRRHWQVFVGIVPNDGFCKKKKSEKQCPDWIHIFLKCPYFFVPCCSLHTCNTHFAKIITVHSLYRKLVPVVI